MKNLRKTSYNSGFSLVELMVVMGIIGVLAVVLFPALTSNQQTSRDNARKIRANQVKQAIEEKFRQEYYAYPLASAGSLANKTAFENASGLETTDAAEFVLDSTVCTNMTPTNNTPAKNYIWRWFGEYFVDITNDQPMENNMEDYKLFMSKIGGDIESKDIGGGFVYKGKFVDGQFKYEVAYPFEKPSADARKDGGALGDRWYEFGDLVGTENEIKAEDVDCLKYGGKLPFGIKVTN